ncbi:hypothetical protein NLX71_01610 [Paenibacillus sp. MZ04-78.2]|uniref:hypothetical protein n=1 Tax=Paenibacillus sp. MZ04-78.2 TaxID=2962034 RepID=UPI0020B6DF3D|nr:hypothetical protein [Paenibacillus sp. MZ04-78.2]MCP3772017.1 hypothetical protein [Paenibacillus sp. MZ04-78.2]
MNILVRNITVCALAVLTLTTSSVYAANDQEKIPRKIQELADSKVSPKQPIPELRAWETDLNGNTTEVVPLSQRVQTLSPPSDGFVYVFSTYNPNYVTKDWRYQNLGTFRYQNSTSAPATIQYEQTYTTAGKWNVGVNISGKSEIKAAFLAKLEVAVGGSWGYERQWTSGTKYGANQTVNPNTTIYLTNYQVGANTSGLLVWKKYSPSGTSLLGTYTETAGGYAVSMSDLNIEVTGTQPN